MRLTQMQMRETPKKPSAIGLFLLERKQFREKSGNNTYEVASDSPHTDGLVYQNVNGLGPWLMLKILWNKLWRKFGWRLLQSLRVWVIGTLFRIVLLEG
ncbi:hypothetical protein CEXT_801271 [Caerostris extrusa]|uniref:Uncharacterized protein n=1 Tax=Caerostris extrusa TaxID=172846 RepID=A0AAV4PXK9_CAEEX|nr:hypothetical protein CEXT_801271 [Caerostris extrusa]